MVDMLDVGEQRMDDLQRDVLATVEAAIAEYRAGRFVIIVDDEDRENEGDLAMAAEHITPEAVNFMATHGRGLICAALTGERLDALNLPLMVPQDRNRSGFGTGFTLSVEARSGVTTGISAFDRAHTIRTLIDPRTTAEDLATPGHMFPLRARAGGVLERRGQTEASVDLARLAGLTPAGVICEILAPDGTMERLPGLIEFARRHGLCIVTVEALAQHLRAQGGVDVAGASKDLRAPKRAGQESPADSDHTTGEKRMGKVFEGKLIGTGLKIGIVASRWNDFMGGRLLEGAKDALIRHDVRAEDIDVAYVPGSFEIPLVAQKMASSGRYDAVVCLGVLIRGSTPHFDYIAGEASKGIAHASWQSGVPVTFGVITTENIEQAIERSGSKAGNKGVEAAMAAIEMANLLRQM